MIALVLPFLAFAPVQDFPDPIGPAASGKLQCYMPDAARRTCQSLAGYRSDGKGGFVNDAEILVDRDSAITMRSVTPVEIRDGGVCGRIIRESVEKAVFTLEGKPVAPAEAERMRALAIQSYERAFGREICTFYRPEADHFRTSATIDGEYADLRSVQVIWVRPDQGYRIAF